MDEGYLNPDVNAYVDWIGRKMIINQRGHRGGVATPWMKLVRYGVRWEDVLLKKEAEAKLNCMISSKCK